MKLLRAYVRHHKAMEVIDALRHLKAPRVTATTVMAVGDEVDPKELHLSSDLGITYTNMVKIELICNDECVEMVKETILTVARTGLQGDGLIATSPVEEALSIRTREPAIEG
jgi:nitrogen regulatory protein PII